MIAPMPKTPHSRDVYRRCVMWALLVLVVGLMPSLAFAQGSIFGVVQNSDLSNPGTSDLYWIGFLDNTDEEIRIKTSTGAGYDGLNWFDDFQNYTTEVAGNPYDYYFINVTNGQAFHLEKTIPANSFQQENVQLATSSFPARPSGLVAQVASGNRINLSWTYQPGVTYHVYRRATSNNGVFRRVDDPTGSLANPGVADSFFVDATSDGVSNYTYIIIGENGSGGWSAHSVEVAILGSSVTAPLLTAVDPDSGSATGMPLVTVRGSNFDVGGMTVTFGGIPATNVTVVSPFELTCNVPAGSPGFVDVVATNTASGLSSGALVNGFLYLGNAAPVFAAVSNQAVDEGQNLNFGVSATDVDNDSLILTAENVPLNATFTDNFNGTGTFDFKPDFQQAGIYSVRFIASDGAQADTQNVQITVNQVNLAPVWNTVGAQNVDEGQNLNLLVMAGDPDEDSLILTAENMPLNMTFTDHGDGTGTIDFNPDFTQAGLFNVRLIASDGVLADTENVAITVNDVNQAPVLAAIGAQLVNEGANLNFGVSGSDPDGDSVILSAEGVPANATFTDNFNGTGTFDFNPDYSQAGLYNVRFIVSDGALADTEVVAITVNGTNLTPSLAAIPPQFVDEGQNLNVVATASDPDGDSLVVSAINLPPNATFVDNFDGTGTLEFNPDFQQAGFYTVQIIASDGVLADTIPVDITVNQVNLPPVFNVIGGQNVNEGQNLNFLVLAGDPDEDSVIMTAEGLPLNSTFTDHGDGSGTFDFNPDFTQSGLYNVTFIASDGVLADTQIVAITVNDAGNQAPVLASIGAQAVTEGLNLNVGVSATDPDLDSLILSVVGLPANATFTDNFDGTGTFDFNPDFTQASVYNVTFIASDGVLADTEIVAVTVNDAGNQKPVLAAIGAQVVNEGQNLNFGASATDADLDSLIFSAVGVPANATFSDNFNGTATFDFNPDFTQAGIYNVDVIVSDGGLADTETVQITVIDAGNQAPVLAAIGPQVVTEGQNLNVPINATDADLDSLILTAVNVPLNATFTDNFDGTGTFDFNPDFVQAGPYSVTFIASDGALADTEIVSITVNDAGNQAPVLATIGAQSVTEGQNLTVPVSATDADLDSLILSAVGLPTNASFTDNFDGTGTFDFNPDFVQSGVYNVTFIASDGALADSEIVVVTVNDAGNQRPVVAATAPQLVNEGANLNFGVSASDPDLDSLILSAANLPLNATFTDNFDGTGTVDFNPDFTQSGVYNVDIIASDGALADTATVQITVNDAGNQRPVLAAIGAQVVDEGQNLNVPVSATDADLDSLILSASGLPANATFTDNFDGTGTFDFNPDFTQSGVINVDIIASDGALADTESVQITINDVNLAPQWAVIAPQVVQEGANLNLGVSATDPDVDSLVLTAENMPLNATFTDNFNGTGTFDFNPDFTQSGLYNVTFIASDGALADTQVVAITVNEAGNQAPILASIGSQLVDENANLNVPISATDADGDSLILTAESLPANATFTDSFNGTGVFDFNPSYFQAGSYNVRFIVSDGLVADSEVVAVMVNNVNQLPVLNPIGPLTVAEGDTLITLVSAVDGDSVIPAITAAGLPSGAIFSDSANGKASLFFRPLFNQQGVYNVRFYASDGVDADSEAVTLTVTDAGNQPPVLATIGTQSFPEGDTLRLRISAVDADSTIPILTAESLPPGATFSDSLNGAGAFVFPTNYNSGGNAYQVRFIASDGVIADTELVLINVLDLGNLPPVFDSVGAKTVKEGDTLIVLIHAVDPEGGAITLGRLSNILNATFVDSGNGYGVYRYRPNYYQSGVDTARILAIDNGTPSASKLLIMPITTQEKNIAPNQLPIGNRTVVAGDSLKIRVVATDSTAPPGNILTMLALNLPDNATYQDSGNGIGKFKFKPTFAQLGDYNVTFVATDNGVPSLVDQEIITISVLAANRPPVLATIGPKQVTEGNTLTFNVYASDPDSTIPFFYVDTLPMGATLVDSANGVATFSWTPAYFQAGLYSIKFSADDGDLTDFEQILIQVKDAGNQAPVLVSIGNLDVVEKMNLTALITAFDPDATTPTLAIDTLIENATFVDSGNGTAIFSITPQFWQDSVYTLLFTADDGEFKDSEYVTLTILDVGNQTPYFTDYDTLVTVTEGAVNFQFHVAAADSDRTTPSLVARPLPAFITFADSGNGGGLFRASPTFADSGMHVVYAVAVDEESALVLDSVPIQVYVNDANQAPVIGGTGNVSWGIVSQIDINPGQSATVWIRATDIDGTIPIMRLESGLVANMQFTDTDTGVAYLTFSPTYAQENAPFQVYFRAKDRADTTILSLDNPGFKFRVLNHPVPPVLDPIGPKSVTEGSTLQFIITASDSNVIYPQPVVRAFNYPANVSLDSTLGTGRLGFTFHPNYTQAGVYYVLFQARDFVGLIDTERVAITVNEAGNQLPVWTTGFPTDTFKVAYPGVDTIIVHGYDIENPSPTMLVQGQPWNATFVKPNDTTGRFIYGPLQNQTDSVYTVRFIISDGLAADTNFVIVKATPFKRGDLNADGKIDALDLNYLIDFLFFGGPNAIPAREAGNVNGLNDIDAIDLNYLVDYIFFGGPAPPP